MDGLVERLREFDGAATPGPWDWSWKMEIDGPNYSTVMETGVSCMAYCYGGSPTLDMSDEDRRVAVEARNALPRLLDVVDAAGRVVAEHQYVDPWIGELAAALANLDVAEAGQ